MYKGNRVRSYRGKSYRNFKIAAPLLFNLKNVLILQLFMKLSQGWHLTISGEASNGWNICMIWFFMLENRIVSTAPAQGLFLRLRILNIIISNTHIFKVLSCNFTFNFYNKTEVVLSQKRNKHRSLTLAFILPNSCYKE